MNLYTLDSSFFWKILFLLFFCYCFLSLWPKCKAISGGSEIRGFHWFAPLRVHSQSFHAWDYAAERGPDKLSAWNAGCSPCKSSCHYCFCLEKSAGDEYLTFAWQRGVSDLHLSPRGCAPHRGKHSRLCRTFNKWVSAVFKKAGNAPWSLYFFSFRWKKRSRLTVCHLSIINEQNGL